MDFSFIQVYEKAEMSAAVINTLSLYKDISGAPAFGRRSIC